MEGRSIEEIRRLLTNFGVVTKNCTPLSHNNILYILQNEVYKGDKLLQRQPPKDFLTKKPDNNAYYESYYLKGDHEPIVVPEVWDAVQEKIKQNRSFIETVGHLGGRPNFLYGKVFCAECGNPMKRRSYTSYKGMKYKAWICRDRFLGCEGNGCRMRIVREMDLMNDICTHMNWEKFNRENFETEIKRVMVSEDGIEIWEDRSEVEKKMTL